MSAMSCIICGVDLPKEAHCRLDGTMFRAFSNLFEANYQLKDSFTPDQTILDGEAFAFCKRCHGQVTEINSMFCELEALYARIESCKKIVRGRMTEAYRIGVGVAQDHPSWLMRKGILEKYELIVTPRSKPKPSKTKSAVLAARTNPISRMVQNIVLTEPPPIVPQTNVIGGNSNLEEELPNEDSDWLSPSEMPEVDKVPDPDPPPPVGTLVHNEKWRRPRVYGHFPCGHCSASFNFQIHRQTHLKSFHRTAEDLTCKECGALFEKRSLLNKHIKKEHDERKPCLCPECGKICRKKSDLDLHMALHSDERPFVCCHCGKAFKTQEYLKRHEIAHVRAPCPSVSKYECTICEKAFTHGSSLKKHMAVVHDPSRAVRCRRQNCGKRFPGQGALDAHIQIIHPPKRPFACDICSHRFPTVDRLDSHRASHLADRPHVCTDCGKGFQLRHHLAQHQVIHSDELPFKCKVCGKGFKWFRAFHNHSKTHTVKNTVSKAQTVENTVSSKIHTAKNTVSKAQTVENTVSSKINTVKNTVSKGEAVKNTISSKTNTVKNTDSKIDTVENTVSSKIHTVKNTVSKGEAVKNTVSRIDMVEPTVPSKIHTVEKRVATQRPRRKPSKFME